MLKIKLTRIGKKHQPTYRIVVKEARSKRDGQYHEALGFYDPLTNPQVIQINKQKYLYWLHHGAQPTLTVKKLALKCKI